MKRVFKIAKRVLDVVSILLIAVMVLTIVISMVSRINGNAPSFFGYTIYRVASGSMEPELMVGDVILDKDVKDPLELKVDDIITFMGSGELDGVYVTHKIIKAPYDDGTGFMLQTQGVANELADEPIPVEKVKGIFVCKVPFLDAVYNVFLSPWGLLIIIGLIIFIFFGEIINLVRAITGNINDGDDGEDINEIIARVQRENNEKSDE